jgi:protein-S-isoprenylcysteine O-methyltransferase Ste14
MGQAPRKMVVHPGCMVVVRSVQAMKRFTNRKQIVSVLVLILATTAWLPRVRGTGSPHIKPLLAAVTLSTAGAAFAEQWARRRAGNTLAELPLGPSQSELLPSNAASKRTGGWACAGKED